MQDGRYAVKVHRILLILLVNATLTAEVIHVPADQPSIQAALNAAQSGDTVLVQPETYYENINWPDVNGIKLISAGDSSNTVIDGGAIRQVISMNVSPFDVTIDNTTLVMGFKITNGGANQSGVFIGNASPTLKKLWVTGNDGSGLSIWSGGSPTLTDMAVTGNTATYGGGLIIASNSNPTLNNVTVSGNTATYGGGLNIQQNSRPILTDVTVTGNTATYGGGIYIVDSSPTLTDVTVSGNAANQGGGLYIGGSGDSPTLTDVTVVFNTARYDGGGLYIEGAYPNLRHLTIAMNSSSNGIGGIYVENGHPSIVYSNIAYNETGLYVAPGLAMTADSVWWGDASGPYHSSQNPFGLGDTVVAIDIDFTPFLTAPDTAAPPIPIQNLATIATGNDFISIIWDPSPIGDLAGYKVYYDSDSSGYPYTNSIEVGTDTSYTLSGLPLSTPFYIAVTCYDTDSNESWYSNEVVATTRVLEAQNLDVGDDEDIQHLTNHTPLIRWDFYDSMAEQQTHYHIQGSSHEDFSTIDLWDPSEIASGLDSINYAGNALSDGDTYYLRVKVSAGGFWSDWSSLEFRMNTAPSTPTALHPINNEVVTAIPALGITNSTDPEGDTLKYRFDLYEDAGLILRLDSALSVTQGTDTTNWAVSVTLPDNGQYWWTVIAHDGYESSILAGPYSFLVNTENNAPGAFSLVSPEADGSVSTLTPAFSWSTAFDPDPLDTVRYSLVLDSPEPGVEVLVADTSLSLAIATPLIDNTKYHWRVIAHDLLGFETISDGDFQSFVVNAGNDPPSPVTLITPDSVKVLDLTPHFYWTAATDPDPNDSIYYHLSYSLATDAVVPVYELYLDTNSVTLANELGDNNAYWWTVNSIDRQGSITQTDTAIFWTDLFPESPGFFATVFPTAEGQGMRPTVEFRWHPAIDPDPLDLVNYSLGYATDWTDSITYTWMYGIVDTTVVISLDDNTEYWWIVEAKDSDGQVTESNDGSPLRFVVGALSIDDLAAIPEEYALHQNYPNPFNPTSTIQYDLPEAANVTLVVYDLLGREVVRLMEGQLEPGTHQVLWDGKTASGQEAPTGIYIARLVTLEYTKSIKMLLLK